MVWPLSDTSAPAPLRRRCLTLHLSWRSGLALGPALGVMSHPPGVPSATPSPADQLTRGATAFDRQVLQTEGRMWVGFGGPSLRGRPVEAWRAEPAMRVTGQQSTAFIDQRAIDRLVSASAAAQPPSLSDRTQSEAASQSSSATLKSGAISGWPAPQSRSRPNIRCAGFAAGKLRRPTSRQSIAQPRLPRMRFGTQQRTCFAFRKRMSTAQAGKRAPEQRVSKGTRVARAAVRQRAPRETRIPPATSLVECL